VSKRRRLVVISPFFGSSGADQQGRARIDGTTAEYITARSFSGFSHA
jgi:hypothetical protein